MSKESPFSKPDRIQIGIIVRDIDRAIEYYESLGIGPFRLLPGLVHKSRTLYGKPIGLDAFKLKIRVANMGLVQIELIEPDENACIWREFLETRGEGIQHLGFFVDDIDKETEEMEKKGIRAVFMSRYQDGGGASYFDTGKIGGVLLELLQFPQEWLQT